MWVQKHRHNGDPKVPHKKRSDVYRLRGIWIGCSCNSSWILSSSPGMENLRMIPSIHKHPVRQFYHPDNPRRPPEKSAKEVFSYSVCKRTWIDTHSLFKVGIPGAF